MRALKKIQTIQSLTDILLKMGLLTQEDLDKAAEQAQKKRQLLDQFLVENNYIQASDLAQAKAQQCNCDYVDLQETPPQDRAWKTLAISDWQKFEAVPLFIDQGTLFVALADPSNFSQIEVLKKECPLPVEIKVATPSQIQQALSKRSKSLKKEPPEITSPPEDMEPNILKASAPASISAKDGASTSVSEIIDEILLDAVNCKASDIHIEQEDDEIRVRYRIDGVLSQAKILEKDNGIKIVSRLKILALMDIAEKRVPQDGAFNFQVTPERVVDLRVSTLPTVNGEKVVLRILDKSALSVQLETLGFTTSALTTLKGLLERPYGIILVAGPTGSGKTTTVYSMLNFVNGPEKNTVTIEDPVEYKFRVMNQVQVNQKANLTFANALKSILRQDPDIIMLGEIRDQETAALAFRAAMTGHLVISTIHTNNAVTTVNRLLDMGVDSFMISAALSGVLSQRLVRLLCPHCKQPSQIKAEEIRALGAEDAIKPESTVYSPKGCDKCYQSGYSGRQPIFELLAPDEGLRHAISSNSSPEHISSIAIKSGFKSMRNHGIRLIASGDTSIEEVLRATL